MVVSRSATICEIDTFITLLSSTITNWAAASTATGTQTDAAGAEAAERFATVIGRMLVKVRARRKDVGRCVRTWADTPACAIARRSAQAEDHAMTFLWFVIGAVLVVVWVITVVDLIRRHL